VALACGEELLASERRTMRHGHGEALLPIVVAVTRSIAATDIDIVAASVGPGGFTGIRVGLAAAQGIALAASARTIGITSFATVAAAICRHDDRGPVLVAIDSRRSDLYVQLIDATGEPVAAPAAIPAGDLEGYVAGLIGDVPLLIAGDATEAAAAALSGRPGLDIAPNSAPDALGVLKAARLVWQSTADPEPLSPLYLRSPDVSLPKSRAGLFAPAR